MSSPSQKHPANSVSVAAEPAFPELTEDQAFLMRRVRNLDRGDGCSVTMRELGQGAVQKLSERTTRRRVTELKDQGRLQDVGRAPNGARILRALPRSESAA